MKFLNALALTLALTFAVPAFGVDGVSFGTTSKQPETAPEATTPAPEANGVNDINIEYKSTMKVEEGARVIVEGETEHAAEIFTAINDPEVKRYAMQGLVYGEGGIALENAYKDIQSGDRKSIDAALANNNRIVQALTVAASDPTLPLAKMDRILQSIEGYSLANTFLLGKYGKTEVTVTEEGPSVFPTENHGMDLADLIVFAGIVILLFLASGKALKWAKARNASRMEKKAKEEEEEEAMKEALREKRSRESGTTSRNRRRNRRNSAETAAATEGEAVEA